MAINVSTNFNLGAALSLDSRDVVSTIAERDAIATKYEGMRVYVKETETLYMRKADGTWKDISSQYVPSDATDSSSGLMSPDDKEKLDSIEAGANKYVHPNVTASNTTSTQTASHGGTVNVVDSVTRDSSGHVTGVNTKTVTLPSAPTSVSGNAGTATKLQNARTIALSGGVTGTATSFDGSANITIPVTAVDASKLTGTIDIARLPAGALERCVVVADDTARKALTTAEVQKGDTVKVDSTGLMYFVADDSKLDSEDGYIPYTAGAASSVPWSGVTGKPSTFTPAEHDHAISDITNLQTTLNNWCRWTHHRRIP